MGRTPRETGKPVAILRSSGFQFVDAFTIKQTLRRGRFKQARNNISSCGLPATWMDQLAQTPAACSHTCVISANGVIFRVGWVFCLSAVR